jgi:hypothetical protein
MEFLCELVRMNEGFMPDFDSMSDTELLHLCHNAGISNRCKLNSKGHIANRQEIINDLEAGAGDGADIKQHEAGPPRVNESTHPVNVQKNVGKLYKPVISEANKTAKQAIEDKIGDKGMKGMRKKDRPYMKKPRFRDWMTGNMFFNMTKSGELAGKMNKK